MFQTTLKEAITFQGLGLHTGLSVTLTLHPAAPNNGYTICRTDLPNRPSINAWAEYVDATNRSTHLKRKEVEVGTVEHCMSALYAMGIDNCLMEIDGPEFPILDGSASPYVKEITRVGLQEQEVEREYYHIKNRTEIKDPDTGASILALPSDTLAVEVLIDYPNTCLRNQFASLRDFDEYPQEIAPARTFVFVKDILPLLKEGLIKGGSLDNALILNDATTLTEEEKKQLLSLKNATPEKIEKSGSINAIAGMENEPARHKLLDFLGDLALSGRFIKGHFIVTYPGHQINNQLAREIRKDVKLNESQAPNYNPDSQPLLDVNQIKKLLPHRYPFLMVDKIVEMGSDYIVGVKNITNDEPFFQGHFPEEPVTPGVLIVEAMAQTGGVLALKILNEPKDCSTYFIKIDNVKFRQKVVPGDTLLFKLKMMGPIRRGIAYMRGLAFVGNTLVCEAEFMAQIVINEQ